MNNNPCPACGEERMAMSSYCGRCEDALSSVCPRVAARIECNECGYPASEARYLLGEVADPGHIGDSADAPSITWRPTMEEVSNGQRG